MADWVLADAKKADVFEGGRPYLDTLELRLYDANITLSGSVQPASPSDEVSDSGYAPVANPFPDPAVNSGGQAVATGVNPTFVFDHDGGDFTIYGCFLTDPADSDATVMACAADTPFTVVAAGQVFVVSAVARLDTL